MSSPSDKTTNWKRLDRLFIRLAAIYGHLWSNLYTSEEFIRCTKQEWHAGLQNFDNVTLGKALERCRESIPYPPTLPMFIEVCKALKKENARPIELVELNKCDPAVAKQNLEHIRAMLLSK